jgi:hypothetical protein
MKTQMASMPPLPQIGLAATDDNDDSDDMTDILFLNWTVNWQLWTDDYLQLPKFTCESEEFCEVSPL